MKRGNTGFAVLIIVAVVLGLSLAFVFSDNSQPTGRAVIDPSIIQCDHSCVSNADCSDTDSPCCSGLGAVCSFGTCGCAPTCEEGESCDFGSEETQCGGIGTCQPRNPEGGEGACDCDNDGCAKDASCVTFAQIPLSFVNPCGPNGHCVITNYDDGLGFGTCACGKKPCQYLDAEGFDGDVDKCPNTMRCEEDAQCTSHNDCGGVGVGRCSEGACDCECVSWSPCQNDDDCGDYGEDGNYGDCVAGPDGAFECMCTDDLGCSPKDCVPGETPCTGDTMDCGGNGEDNCNFFSDEGGICGDCGFDCVFFPFGEGTLTESGCEELSVILGSACTFTGGENPKCTCLGIPRDLCFNQYSLSGVSVEGEGA